MNVYSINIQAKGRIVNVEQRASTIAVAIKTAIAHLAAEVGGSIKAATVIAQQSGVVEYHWRIRADVPVAGGTAREDLTQFGPYPSEKSAREHIPGIQNACPGYTNLKPVRREKGVRKV